MPIKVSDDISLELMNMNHAPLFFQSIHEKESETDIYRHNLQEKYRKLENIETRIEDAVNNKRNVDGTPDFFIFYGDKIAGIFEFHPLTEEDHIEVGYWLYEEYRNKGILSKVFPLMIQYAKVNFNKTKILATTSTENIPSQKLLEKMEFNKTGNVLEFEQPDGTLSKEFEYTYNVVPQLHEDILELETENMVPILEKIGMKHEPQKLLEGLKNPQEIITLYRNGQLVALLRYTETEKNRAKVWSIQIRCPEKNGMLLLPLLKKSYLSFRKNEIHTIESVVQISNQKSIGFHERMGFLSRRKLEKSLQYETTLENIRKKLKIKSW
ncbi:MAG: hypothetical protein CL677_06080 [Bdellovibrionaceae bacterium]|nr:hypothetical protein [Pseudobdellovibrionaceae bacterium]|tara:strand:- start:74117 stop:75091 length:975 start_codon:yes stop_codon:yes gene_type:complete